MSSLKTLVNGITGGALIMDNVVKYSKESIQSHLVMLIINELLFHKS